MKKKVFDYVKENPGVSIHAISKAINEREIDILKAIDALLEEGFICLGAPIPLSLDNSDSCRYKALKAEYTEE